MSVEASEVMGDDWTRWQGHVVNGVYPLGRLIGSSAHAGVFETRSGSPGRGQAAIKLIPAGQGHSALQRPQWTEAGRLSHPHILPLLDSGACQLDGLPYLYVVMEYADQTLARLLQQRALTAEEAREMLPPVLGALAFLHGQDLVQGALTPANILVVGDQLKVASDTIRRVGDSTTHLESPFSKFDAPDAGRPAGASTAGDVWMLGLSLYEALTRRSPVSFVGHRNAGALPADFPPEFRDLVARCLRHDPQDRPSVVELLTWVDGRPVPPTPETIIPPTAPQKPAVRTSEVAPVPAVPAQAALDATQPLRTFPIRWAAVALAAAAILGLGWSGVALLKSHGAPDVAQNAPTESAAPTGAPAPLASAASTTDADRSDAPERLAIHEELPAPSKSAVRTIHGQVQVTLRAAVQPGGSVSRVHVDRGGRSRYFQQLSLQAAKKWTFTPVSAGPARQVEIQFDFTRDGTTGRATLVP